jgi:hypothetical protein
LHGSPSARTPAWPHRGHDGGEHRPAATQTDARSGHDAAHETLGGCRTKAEPEHLGRFVARDADHAHVVECEPPSQALFESWVALDRRMDADVDDALVSRAHE